MKIRLLVIAICVLLFPKGSFSAEDESWQFELAPLYLWAISIDGDLGISNRSASASVDFGSVWDNLQGVFTARFNGLYNNKVGFLFDYNYLDLGTERVNDLVNTEAGVKSQIINFAGVYRFAVGTHSFDAVAGLRHMILDAEIDFNNRQVGIQRDQDWTDPVIGLRYGLQITDDLSMRLFGDVGGFGVSSDFTWQGAGLVEYHPWENVSLLAGYRAIGVDYETGSAGSRFVYDATIYGPVVGLNIIW